MFFNCSLILKECLIIKLYTCYVFLGVPGHVSKDEVVAKLIKFGNYQIVESVLSREEASVVVVYGHSRGTVRKMNGIIEYGIIVIIKLNQVMKGVGFLKIFFEL